MAVTAFGDERPWGCDGKLGGTDALFGDEETAGFEECRGSKECHDFGKAVIGFGVAVGRVCEDDVGVKGRRAFEPCKDIGNNDTESSGGILAAAMSIF